MTLQLGIKILAVFFIYQRAASLADNVCWPEPTADQKFFKQTFDYQYSRVYQAKDSAKSARENVKIANDTLAREEPELRTHILTDWRFGRTAYGVRLDTLKGAAAGAGPAADRAEAAAEQSDSKFVDTLNKYVQRNSLAFFGNVTRYEGSQSRVESLNFDREGGARISRQMLLNFLDGKNQPTIEIADIRGRELLEKFDKSKDGKAAIKELTIAFYLMDKNGDLAQAHNLPEERVAEMRAVEKYLGDSSSRIFSHPCPGGSSSGAVIPARR